MTITKTLTSWYSINKRNFPWRNTTNPYCIWLSEIILQQTQIKQGLPYYEAFIHKYPTVFDLANASESDILKLWQGLGYYSRARNLHATAKHVVENLDGQFPDNYKDLLKLKGIGDYTASAIASICYNENTAVLDGNVFRFLSRYFGIDTPINTTLGFKTFKNLAQDIIDPTNPAEHNQAIMDFGSRQCSPSSPDCTICPFNKTCVAYRDGLVNRLPVKLKAKKPVKKYFNFLVFVSNSGETILEKREENGIWRNLYQFPLIETEKDIHLNKFHSRLKAHNLIKHINYELTLYNDTEIIHKLSHQHLYTKFWIISVNGLPVPGIPIKNIRDYAVPVLIEKFIDDFNF
ncbi:A/G-specific adenine glycosylase [Xanthomarina sp. F2636L]|uniref:A/G-specific adenine glycosylase n=1 Tax=Xanthomarina sp. F2636L TaxID=2996018 RepID=UPI00225E5321|nr:A/G-specific adenine glycosylase [Xanthomarina sp. F2636L]MCX7551045.1 A/G-specific adenine glycosylase [Xanthomarina sp. F2636L]